MLDETIVVENMGMPDGHLNQVSILKNQKVTGIYDLPHHNIYIIYGGHVGF